MAKLTRIKILNTGATTTAPSNIKTGELAYSWVAGTQTNNGDRLYIGTGGDDSNGNSTGVDIIGGKYFTELLNHVPGTLTASTAIITGPDNKISQLNVDNLRLDGNSLTSTDTNGNIVLDPAGAGKTILHNPYVNTSSTGGSNVALEEFIYDTVGGAVTGGTGITVTNSDGADTSTVSTGTVYSLLSIVALTLCPASVVIMLPFHSSNSNLVYSL